MQNASSKVVASLIVPVYRNEENLQIYWLRLRRWLEASMGSKRC